ncbi:MAG: hypothetical protein GTO60_16645 [Gammaproteobacteria bacterium]|nr:hypothetical protein [Gammaproteobacteria bacterium]
MYELSEWVMWAGWMLPILEGAKMVMNNFGLKTRLKDEAYTAVLYGIAFIIGLVICVSFEADLFLSMTGEYRFEPFVGYVAGAVALAGGETLLSEVWDWKHLLRMLKPAKPGNGEPTNA